MRVPHTLTHISNTWHTHTVKSQSQSLCFTAIPLIHLLFFSTSQVYWIYLVTVS
jgi:hypothetical protein